MNHTATRNIDFSSSTRHPRLAPVGRRIPLLRNGDRMDSKEFLRRYDAMPDLKKAELIDGVAYVRTSPVSLAHSNPDAFAHGWLFNYSAATPGIAFNPNPTVALGPVDTPQPDAVLRILPEFGGRTSISERNFIQGAPELIVEIAVSSSTLDLGKKSDMYLRFGAPEYLVWETERRIIHWGELFNGAYRLIPPDKNGFLRSVIFPGLWLDPQAFFDLDAARAIDVLKRGLRSAAHARFVKSLAEKA